MLLLMMESMSKDRSAVSDRTTKFAARDSVVAKGKKSEATSSKTIDSDRNIGECQNEKISNIEDTSTDKSKFKKVKMSVFIGNDLDLWLFHSDRTVEVTNNGKVELNCTEATFTELDPIHIVLKQYEDIFEWPKKLPPRREIKHHIYFKESTDPINVRPYRYGYHQKEEMEKLVEEMLASGVMRPSKSPFSNLHYGSIAAPLTQLLKKGRFKWNEEAKEAFEKLKKAMLSLPVLALPSFDHPFDIEMDAFGYGVSVLLTQSKRPISFYSHTLAMRD
ncbi:transposon Tf2-1 polyprotein isoform X1 [Cucumis melo var. makuwa]|uniref:Transposon Tf2-1 polyprotein isoform X1 n=1 Tax=Cucumis melo var. makuwa TaxID=1194695 RepID=A0A5D3C0J0_CUCMM|nr:transposon Tf2-1 polyprotein isoform X1 [Cucumis melo var. makuwa]